MRSDGYEKKKIEAEGFNQLYSAGHSRAYHNYFEGYAEFVENDDKGRRKIRRVYVWSYYSLDKDLKGTRAVRIIETILFVLSAGLYIFFGLQDHPVNSVWYVNLLQAVSFALFVFSGKALANCLLHSRMTIHEYKIGPGAMEKVPIWNAVSIAVTAVAQAAAGVFSTPEGSGFPLIILIGTAVSSGLMFGLYFFERAQKYTTVPNENHVEDPAAVVLQNR